MRRIRTAYDETLRLYGIIITKYCLAAADDCDVILSLLWRLTTHNEAAGVVSWCPPFLIFLEIRKRPCCELQWKTREEVGLLTERVKRGHGSDELYTETEYESTFTAATFIRHIGQCVVRNLPRGKPSASYCICLSGISTNSLYFSVRKHRLTNLFSNRQHVLSWHMYPLYNLSKQRQWWNRFQITEHVRLANYYRTALVMSK